MLKPNSFLTLIVFIERILLSLFPLQKVFLFFKVDRKLVFSLYIRDRQSHYNFFFQRKGKKIATSLFFVHVGLLDHHHRKFRAGIYSRGSIVKKMEIHFSVAHTGCYHSTVEYASLTCWPAM